MNVTANVTDDFELYTGFSLTNDKISRIARVGTVGHMIRMGIAYLATGAAGNFIDSGN